MNRLAAAVELVRAVDQLRVLKRAGRDEPVDAYRVQCARDRFDGRAVKPYPGRRWA